MTYEKGLFAQADPGIVSGSTIERKKMSTKTSFKRIALVAVTALGAGVLSVAPASAATSTTYLIAGIGTVTPAVPVAGTQVVIPVTATNTGTVVSAINPHEATLTTIPSNSLLTATSTTSDITGFDAAEFAATVSATRMGIAATAAVAGTTGAQITITNHTTDIGAYTAVAIGSFAFTPDVPGKYVLTISGSTAKTVTITVSGAALLQANSGLGKAAGTQIVGRQSAAVFTAPKGSVAGTQYQITATGASIISVTQGEETNPASATSYAGTTTGVNYLSGSNFASGAIYTGVGTVTQAEFTGGTPLLEQLVVQFSSATAGDAVLTIKSVNGTTGALTTVGSVTVTYGSADALTLSLANSEFHMAKSNDAPDVTSDAVAVIQSAAVATQRANIRITLNDGTDAPLYGQTVSASLSGPGLIAWASTRTGDGTQRGTLSYTMGASENEEFLVVSGDGSGGVATITFKIGTTTIATKTITFYGAATTLSAVINDAYIENGAVNNNAVFVTAKDANGVVVPGTLIYAKSGSTTIATVAATATTETAALASVASNGQATLALTAGTAAFTVTGGTKGAATLTFGLAADYSTGTTTAVVNTVDDVAETVTMAFDKASYTPGEKATLTITAKDVNGSPVADDSVSTSFLAGACTPSLSISSAIFDANVKFNDGKATAEFFMPATSAPFTVTCVLGAAANEVGTLLAAKVLTASAAVSTSAEISAITTLINSLIAKINALNKLVIKIQKKVRA
jgi:hypothetical protein